MGVSGRAGVGGPPSGDAQLTIQSGLDSYIRMGESGSGHVDLAFNQAESELEIRPRKKQSYQRGDMRLSAENVYPAQPYATNIGSLQEKFLSIHAAELWVETLVAQETIATIGGRVFVGPTTTLTDPVSGDPDDADPRPVFDFYNYIRTRHNQMRPGDTVLLQARARVEFMRVISGPEELDPIESASETYLVHLFKRASSEPEAPEGGGQYVDPKIPQGWSDAIPSGTQTLWMSRVSYTPEDNGPASAWPDPIEFSVDEGYYQGHPERYVIFSSEESPGDPEPPVGDPFGEPDSRGLVTWDTNHEDNADWTDSADGLSVWMGIFKYDGVSWDDFTKVQIQGQGGGPLTSAFDFAPGRFRYEVERDLDGSGPNAWAEGDAVVSTGRTGSGFIDLYATRSSRAANEAGPTIAISKRTSDPTDWPYPDTEYYNEWETRTALGNLDGLYDYREETYGFAAGNYLETWLGINNESIRLRVGASCRLFQALLFFQKVCSFFPEGIWWRN